jgi:hypothetical protein
MVVAGLAAVAPLVFPNVESVVASFLQGRAELTGMPVGSDVPAAFDGTQRAVVLTRLGGLYVDDDQLDHAEVRIDSYGPDKVSAQPVALTVRGLLPLLVAGNLQDGVVISDVTEIQGPLFSIDLRHSGANRYIMKYRFTVEVTSRPA